MESGGGASAAFRPRKVHGKGEVYFSRNDVECCRSTRVGTTSRTFNGLTVERFSKKIIVFEAHHSYLSGFTAVFGLDQDGPEWISLDEKVTFCVVIYLVNKGFILHFSYPKV